MITDDEPFFNVMLLLSSVDCNIHHEIASVAPCGRSMRLSEAGGFTAVESNESTGSTRRGLSELAEV